DRAARHGAEVRELRLGRVGLALFPERAERLRVARAEREDALCVAHGEALVERGEGLVEASALVRGLAVSEPGRGGVLRERFGLRPLVEGLAVTGFGPPRARRRLDQP